MANIPLERIRNIGISAHIDSGKTTLTERILYYTGKIREIHEVRGKDGVGATMDSMDLEREKGITIQSAATYAQWNGSLEHLEDYNINIIDTPGHVDFTIEVERSLRVLDGAILVLDSVAGVQSQSITVDRQMKRYGVPRICFVNKMDRAGANYQRCADMLKEKLGHHSVPIQVNMGAEDKFLGVIDPIMGKAYFFDGEKGENVRQEAVPAEYAEETKKRREEIVEKVAEVDDTLAEKFLNGEEVSGEELRAAVRRATIALKMTPVMCGTAYKNKGVQTLLDAVCMFLPSPPEVQNIALDQKNEEAKVILESTPDKSFVGLAFKLQQDQYGQLTYFRVYQGQVKAGEFINNCSRGMKKERVPRMFRMHSDRREEIQVAQCGDIVAFYGIDATSGDTFTDGSVNYTLTSMHVPDAVISLAVSPKDRAAEVNFSKALNRFTKEDPTFRVHRDEESGQTIIRGMGELHLDIYMERMRREYQCDVVSGKPQVAYRETVTQRGEFAYTHKKQTGGAGQFARVCGYLEPLPADAVLHQRDRRRLDPPRVHPRVRQGLPRGREEGLAHRLPGVGHPLRHQRRRLPRGRLQRAGVQDRGHHGLPRGLRARQAGRHGAGHEGRGPRAHRVPGRRGRPAEPAPGRHPRDVVGRGLRHRRRRGAAQHDVRLLHGPPVGHPGEGRVLDGVRQVLPGAARRAGVADEALPREASGRAGGAQVRA